METINFKVDVEKAGIRIDRYLADVCLDFSRSYLQKLLKDQMVSVNGKVVKANYKTRAGDRGGTSGAGYAAARYQTGRDPS